MKRWQYYTVMLVRPIENEIKIKLNDLGKDGWEAWSINLFNGKVYIFFKKEIGI